MRARATWLSLSILAASACKGGDSTGPSTEGKDVVLSFCASPPSMVAYQNQGDSWTNAPLVNGSASFKAAAKTVVMMTWPPLGGSTTPHVNFFFVSGSELQLWGAADRCALAASPKSLSGSVANVDFDRQRALVHMGEALKYVLGPLPTFAITAVPGGPVDLVATRRASTTATLSNRLADRVIIRRAVDLPTGSTMPVLDFDASEALRVASNMVTISGQGADDLFMYNNLITAAMTDASLEEYSFFSFSAPLISVSSANLVSGDIHQLGVVANSGTNADYRGALLHYRAAGDKNLSLGAALAPPRVTVVGTTPFVRLRVQLASQSDYPDLVQFVYSQTDGGGKFVRVIMTKGYFGGTPTTWDVSIPDASAVAGFQSSWMLQTGVATAWDGEAWLVSMPWFFGGAPADGSTFNFATRSSSINTAAAGSTPSRSFGGGLVTQPMAMSQAQRVAQFRSMRP